MLVNPLRPNLPPGVVAQRQYGEVLVQVVEGDLLESDAEAIVNPANEHLTHAGGLAAAIMQRAGEIVRIESERIGHVSTGESVVTGAGPLPARYIIHTVGPMWKGGGFGEAEMLATAVTSSLTRAGELGLASIAMPAISCGIFSYPPAKAAGVIIRTIRIFCENVATSLRSIRLVMNEHGMAEQFGRVLQLEEATPSEDTSEKVTS